MFLDLRETPPYYFRHAQVLKPLKAEAPAIARAWFHRQFSAAHYQPGTDNSNSVLGP
jgi:hypothetical protein